MQQHETENDEFVEMWPTKNLHPHPHQAELVGDYTDAELDELTASIRDHGIRQPIEVLPDGTIVAGHQRWRAACQLQLPEVPVRVKHDLAEAGEAAVLTYLIEDNALRRQMTPLDLARAYRALKEIEQGRPQEELYYGDRREIRDRLAKRLGAGVSGRTLDRYEKLLDTPRVIQDAVSGQLLPMTLALKVADLHEDRKEEIAQRVAAGEPAREVVKSMLEQPEPSEDASMVAYRRLLATLESTTDLVGANVQSVVGEGLPPARSIPLLSRSIEVLEGLRDAEVAARDLLQQRLADLDDDEDWDSHDCDDPDNLTDQSADFLDGN